MNLTIFGYNGFIGRNLLNFLDSKDVSLIERNLLKNFNKLKISTDCFGVINLIGKAHDLKKNANPDEYYYANTELLKNIYDAFLISNAKVFITISSVKAVADSYNQILTEECSPNPITIYGKSKLLAEQYILSREIPNGKRVFILRPCMIHGPGNKGNLNLLYNIVRKGIPWPLGSFNNKRSFCSIDNLCFIINELLHNEKIPSGIYNIADDEALSTNELIKLISKSMDKSLRILNIPRILIHIVSKFGDLLMLPLNTNRLSKLTETYVISNQKIKTAINKPLPISTKDGLLKTFNSLN